MAQIIFRFPFLSQCFRFLCFASFLPFCLPAQEYRFNPTREWIIGGSVLVHAGINIPVSRSTQPLTQIPPAPKQLLSYTYRPQVAHWSDGLIAAGAIMIPAAVFSNMDVKAGTQAMAVCAQSMLMNLNITKTLKHSIRRPRPLVFASGTPAERIYDRDARLSFPSGHASTAFCLATSLSLALRTYEVKLATRQWITGSAFALAGTTAVLRVVAGKHYPGDVLAGAALGTGIALLNHYLHAPR
jgi:membrane-associated phospholipid phosphatase